MSDLVWHLEEPRVGQSYPNYYASRLGSRFTKVILSGAGGDEASLFAGDLYKMYSRYFSLQGWKVEPITINEGSVGGYNKIVLEINISNLAGVPSIIYGLLGLEVFVRIMNLGASVLAGSLTLSLLILPIIIVATREAIKAVPTSIKDASYALGASKWQTIWYQILPASSGGILTGVILALSRAVGETAPLIVIGALAYVPFAPSTPMDEFSVLPIQIFNWISRPQHGFIENAAAAIIILLLITFVMNGIAVYFRNKWQKKLK